MRTRLLTITVVAGPAAPGTVRVTVAGEIDQVTVVTLREVLDQVAADQPRRIEIDLAAVTFFSCAGLAALIATREAVDGAQVVINASPAVLHLIEVLHLQLLLTCAPPA